MIRGDDAVELYMSGSEADSPLSMVAHQSRNWQSWPEWPLSSADQGTTRTTARMELVAGRRYFYELQCADGGGGDFCSIGVRIHASQMKRFDQANTPSPPTPPPPPPRGSPPPPCPRNTPPPLSRSPRRRRTTVSRRAPT